MKKIDYKKHADSFKEFTNKKENRKTIIIIIVVCVMISSIGFVKKMLSGEKYIVGENGRVSALKRSGGKEVASFPLEVEASKDGKSIKKEVTVTIGNAKGKTAENKADEDLLLENAVDGIVSKLSKSTGSRIKLPSMTDDGVGLSWTRSLNADEVIVLFMAPVLIWLIYLNGEKKKREKEKKRVASVELALPSFNDELYMLLGSGLIFRDAFRRVADGYRESPDPGYFQKEMIDVDEVTDSGARDIVSVITSKAEEIGVTEFSRIVSMIRDNQLKGVELSSKLGSESEILWDLRKKKAEEKGRLAETKLTLPLAILLMVLIMITAAPAIIQVQG